MQGFCFCGFIMQKNLNLQLYETKKRMGSHRPYIDDGSCDGLQSLGQF